MLAVEDWRCRYEEAEKEAEKGLTLLLDWGSPWDKRMWNWNLKISDTGAVVSEFVHLLIEDHLIIVSELLRENLYEFQGCDIQYDNET
ncbi:hypothetical protein AgCh_009139 [Apium graveolens]